MAKPSKDRHGTYKIRKVVPVHLRYIIQKTELKRSLFTKSPNEAKLKAPAVLAEFDAVIEKARMLHDSESKITDGVIQALVFNWQAKKATELKSSSSNPFIHNIGDCIEINSDAVILPLDDIDNVFNRCKSKFDDYGKPKDSYCRTPKECRAAFHCKANNGVKKINKAIEQLRLSFGNELEAELLGQELVLTSDSLSYRKLLVEFAKSYLKVSDVAFKKTSVELSLKHLGEGIVPGVTGDNEHTVESLFTEYCSAKRRRDPDAAEALIKDYSTSINKFIKYSPNHLISNLTKRDIAGFRTILEQLPSTQKKDIKSLSLTGQIELADKNNLPRLSPLTVKNQMMALSGLCTFAKDEGLIDVNPVEGTTRNLSGKIDNSASAAKDYRREEILAIFSSKLFTEHYGPKKADYGRAHYWLPLLLYYTGARAEEIAQLDVADVYLDEEYPYLRLTNEGDDQSIKTGVSRQVTIHSHLLELGITDYISSLNGHKKLFPKLKRNNEGKYNVQVSKWFGNYLKNDLGIKRNGIKPFHSFRHHFMSHLRLNNIRPDIQNNITGHSQTSAGTGAIYGSYSLEQMSEVINTLPRCF
jgi:integrase